jgi:hypothetical protein
MTNQPSYWCIANIGDADPYEHGGAFVLVDRRGIYCPELVTVESFDDSGQRIVHNIQLERLTIVKSTKPVAEHEVHKANGWIGVSDNRFHTDTRAWFGIRSSLRQVAACIADKDVDSFISDLVSSDPITVAFAYKALADYHGYANFDEYPNTVSAEKAELMCNKFLAQIEESQTWHDGYYP